ncbi:hypothetical protein FQN54_006564 [Arachnomyces sp. PD_36]|nr:hypothetical protein FQN54_006564 [Arachnomyces sp. PD_36]
MDSQDPLIELVTNPEFSMPPGNPQWSQLLEPYLKSALIHADAYNSNDIRNHLDFFNNIIAPNLGPGPLVGTQNGSSCYQPQYPSSMTNDLTPFELSLCWKSPKQEGKPIVRFVNDIIPPNAERSRAASIAQSLRLIRRLQSVIEKKSSPLTLHMLPDIWKAVSKALLVSDSGLHSHNDCSQCGSSSCFVGFDLKQSVVSGKFYWRLPSCMGVKKTLEIMDEVFSACSTVHDFLVSPIFRKSWAHIRDHLCTHSETLAPCMLSIDATAFPAPRIKIYVRCRFQGERNFEAWEQHLHVDGSVTCPDDFRSNCRDIWTSLATSPEYSMHPQPDAGPEYCLILYELTAPSASTIDEVVKLRQKLSSKLYIMCQEIPLPDSFIAAQLLRHCNLTADSSLLKYEWLHLPNILKRG